MLTLVRQARRRLLRNELLAEGANACSAALLAFILLLLFGAQLLSWEWFLLIPAAAIAIGVYRAQKRVPSMYRVAQVVDHRMELADTLSTALYFSEDETARRVPAEMRRTQAERAESVARSVDVRLAVPFTLPRGIYVMAGLVLVASSLFALRYGLSRRLDLRPPLASMLMQQLGWTPKHDVAKDARKTPPVPDAQQDDSGNQVAEQDQQGQQQQEGEQNQEAAANGDEASNKTGASREDGKKQSESSDERGTDEQDAQAEKASDAEAANSDSAKNGQQGSKNDQSQQNGKPDANSSADSPSLLSKVKDAVQNLLSRMKPQQGSQQPQQGQNQQQANAQKGQGQQNDSKQQSAKNGQQNGEQSGEAQDGQNGEEAKNQQDPSGKGTGKSDSRQASKQPGSGVGSQDGDKSIRQAEQLAAMGKISEILGKRSASITGEATVEVQSTSQQLHTQYVQRGAQHTQGGAEISRDEIPVALQNYVEQYFEQVRKQTPAAASTKKQ